MYLHLWSTLESALPSRGKRHDRFSRFCLAGWLTSVTDSTQTDTQTMTLHAQEQSASSTVLAMRAKTQKVTLVTARVGSADGVYKAPSNYTQ